MNNRDINLLSSTDGHDDCAIPGRTEGGDRSLRGEAGHLGQCPCCGGPAGLPRWPDYAAVRRAVSGPPCSVCADVAAAAASDRVPGIASADAAGSAFMVEPASEGQISALPVRCDRSERLPGEVETLPWPRLDGLKARWGGLVSFGLGGPHPVDESHVVEPWPLRSARSAALAVGAWGLGTEIRGRRRLQLARLWITGQSGLWTKRATAYTSSRIDDDQAGS